MEILEHTSTHLTLKDSAVTLVFLRLIAGIYLILYCVILLMLFMFFFLVLPTKVSSFPLLCSIAFILLSLAGITILLLFPSINTFIFDKNQEKLIINSKSLLGTKTVEYPLSKITKVIVERNGDSKYNYYTLALKLGFNSPSLSFSSTTFTSSDKAEEMANLIRRFLSANSSHN